MVGIPLIVGVTSAFFLPGGSTPLTKVPVARRPEPSPAVGRLSAEEVGRLRAEMADESGRPIWEAQDSFPLTLDERELKENRSRRFRMEFPLLLDKDVDRLKNQKIRLEVSVKNTTEGEELRKALEFRLKF